MAFLGPSVSLPPSALRPFPTWVDISQQYLMYIWPLMLSPHVPEPEAQLKLTTPRPSKPPSNLPFVSPTSFCLTHYFSSLTYFLSTLPLLPSCHCAPLLFPFLLICDSALSLSYPSSLASCICSPSLTQECLPCFAASSSFSIVTWQSIIYGHTGFAFPPILVIVLLETSELQFQHIAHFLIWYMVRFMWRQYPDLSYSIWSALCNFKKCRCCGVPQHIHCDDFWI